ncbi:hypothetical protein FHG87_023396, partial [Trinorchestia longiramus]
NNQRATCTCAASRAHNHSNDTYTTGLNPRLTLPRIISPSSSGVAVEVPITNLYIMPHILRVKMMVSSMRRSWDVSMGRELRSYHWRQHHIGDSIIQGQKAEFKRGLDEHKILCRPKIRLPEAVHLVEDLRCKKDDIVIVLCGSRELEHKTRDEISLQFEALIHSLKNKSKNAIITSILPRRHDVTLNSQILLTNEKSALWSKWRLSIVVDEATLPVMKSLRASYGLRCPRQRSLELWAGERHSKYAWVMWKFIPNCARWLFLISLKWPTSWPRWRPGARLGKLRTRLQLAPAS